MHIGWDLDDVTTNLTEELIRMYNSKYDKNVMLDEVNDWCFFPEEVHKEMKKAGYKKLKLKVPARRILQELKKRGDRVSIITYRSPKCEEETREWLERNIGGLYDTVYFAGGTKLEVCRRIGIHVLVDDSKRQVTDVCRELGIHAIMLRTPMNMEIKNSELIHVAETHQDILKWIEKLKPRINDSFDLHKSFS